MGASPSEMANCVNQPCISAHNFTNKHKHRRITNTQNSVFAYTQGGGHNSPQQELEISLRLFPFPTVLSIIYRLRPISRFPVSCFRIHPGMPVTIRHLRRRCLYTINTQQGLTSYAFGLHLLIPTVLSIIYRLRRNSNFRVPNFQHTVSDGFPVSCFRRVAISMRTLGSRPLWH